MSARTPAAAAAARPCTTIKDVVSINNSKLLKPSQQASNQPIVQAASPFSKYIQSGSPYTAANLRIGLGRRQVRRTLLASLLGNVSVLFTQMEREVKVPDQPLAL
jgi:hypothetical protein